MDWTDPLLEDFDQKRVVLFVGSGVSRNSVGRDGNRSPKTWHKFLADIANSHNLSGLVKPYLDARDYLTALDVLRHKLRPEQYSRIIREEYQNPGYAAADIHDAIYRLDCKVVLSPNFDKIYDVYVLEKSIGTITIKEYYADDLAEFIRGDRSVVIKTHGSVDTPAKMIFGRKDYARARTQNAMFYEVLRALTLTHTLLFIGCGIDDPDIRLILEDINFGSAGARSHYFLSAQGAISEEMKQVLLDTMNLIVLEYPYVAGSEDHSSLTTELRALADSLSAAPAAL